ncbi:MAG: glycosyltransferase family 2 protein [Bacteroidota bacterium]
MKYEAVIAAKDARDLIGETLDSLLNSEIPPERIWVIDDASEDDTGAVALTYDRVELLTNKENHDTSYSRNRGLKRVETEYVLAIDADDLVHPQKTKIQMEYLEAHPEVDFAYGDKQGFNNEFQKENYNELLTYEQVEDVFRLVLKRNTIVPGMVMFRTRFFERYGYFDEQIHISNDRELYLRAMIQGATFGYTPGAILFYRQHGSSMLATRYREGIWNNYLTLKKHYEGIKNVRDGKYRKQLATEMRMMARNLNIFQYDFSHVQDAIAMALVADSNVRIQQSRIYTVLEQLIGSNQLERLLRLKFKLIG